MKKLQKGFSLVELLVVVAIIGVLAGVGIVGYSSYTDSAKNRVAIANFNTVKRFVDTELTLLNNNISKTSGALRQGTGNCDTMTTDNAYVVKESTMVTFLKGMSCYFATDGYGNAFKNPYDSAGGSQVLYNATGAARVKGAINIAHVTDGDTVNGSVVAAADHPVDSASSEGYFKVEYFTEKQSTGSGDTVSGLYILK